MPNSLDTIKEIVARTIRECNCEHIELTNKHKIIGTRRLTRHIWRRRICKICGGRFTTYEITEEYFKYLKER